VKTICLALVQTLSCITMSFRAVCMTKICQHQFELNVFHSPGGPIIITPYPRNTSKRNALYIYDQIGSDSNFRIGIE